MKHVCIVGAGLAGACAAAFLARHTRVSLLDAVGPATGASGVAAGIANPVMGRRARPGWHMPEALAALGEVLRLADLYAPPTGLVRPARDAEQADLLQRRAGELPQALSWLPPQQAREQWPDVHAPHGAMLVRKGRAVDVSLLVRRLVDRSGADCFFGDEGAIAALEGRGRVVTRAGVAIEADAILLCTGGLLPEPLAALPLHRVKGQIVRLHAPDLASRLPVLAGDGHVVPAGDAVLVGSTFEHAFADTLPTAEGIAALRAKAAALVPALGGAPLLDARAGLRMTVPGTRLPLLGPISQNGRVWVFNGLGARGLLTAPLLAARLWPYLRDPALIPGEVRPPIVL